MHKLKFILQLKVIKMPLILVVNFFEISLSDNYDNEIYELFK